MKKYANEPFALVGVNSDTDRTMLPKRLEKYRLNWRSFWNGPKGPFGPISKEWKIPTWPYNFVLDADGVVRHRNVGGQELEQAIEALIAEAKQG